MICIKGGLWAYISIKRSAVFGVLGWLAFVLTLISIAAYYVIVAKTPYTGGYVEVALFVPGSADK